MRYILLIFLSFNLLSEPWFNVSDSKDLSYISHQLQSCDQWHGSFISYPVTYGEISLTLEKISNKNLDNSLCRKKIDSIKIYLRDKFIQSREIIFGIQSGTNDQYFQTKTNRYFQHDNYYLSLSDINSNFAYKIKITNAERKNKIYFDESYLAYKYKNHIFTAGRINRWWSPSDSYSLILSNSARPLPGAGFKNYIPIQPQNKILRFLGHINYEFFINKFEKDRAIPNTLLFGNRVTFTPNDTLKVSLIRLAQFGGKNRPKDPSTILKMLVGNNENSLSFDEQPGNQLAGIDFIYNPKFNKNLKIYGQTIGEDEAGYFPSRKMSLFGFSYYLNNPNPTKFSIDYIDTFSGVKNFSYNHFLYKSGLRYYGKPIGASIDADSGALKLKVTKKFNDLNFEFSFSDIHLNKNNSLLNYWTNEAVAFNQLDLLIKYKYQKSYIDLIYTYRDQTFSDFSKTNLFLNLYFKL